jgi:DNA-binding MurR/RpiR family transcriptional regulator
MTVSDLIDKARGRLTPAERRVADVVLSDPQAVAFGTVADIARRASTSGATVVRLAAKLGLDGFTALQLAVRAELADRLRPAAIRIREAPPANVVGRSLAIEMDNLAITFEGVSPADFERVVSALADEEHAVYVVASDASRGVGILFADELSMLRTGVALLQGPQPRVARALAFVDPHDTVIVIDNRRYDRWVLDTIRLARDRGARVVAVCDSALSPLADDAWASFVVRAEGVGPFDSHVGTLALTNALAAAVAACRRTTAADRLDRIEAAWRGLDALIEE